MTKRNFPNTPSRLHTPRSAAIAGIVFALLFGTSLTLIRLYLPTDPATGGVWAGPNAERVSLGLSLIPYAGIAFLWFLGVMRDHIGEHEDRFFSTILLGSGLLFLAMSFVAAALASGLFGVLSQGPTAAASDESYGFGRVVMFHVMNTYALRMAGVFMMSSATIWLRTGVMPGWLAFVSYLLALALLLVRSFNPWVPLIFPAWVLLISIAVLVKNFRTNSQGAEDSSSV